MNRGITFILVVAFIVLCIIGFVYYKNNYFPKYNWNPVYSKSNDQPYGLKLFYDLLKNQKSNDLKVFNPNYEVPDTTLSNSNFISVGNDFFVDSAYADHLLKYIEKGNRVLISSDYSPLELLCHFLPMGDSIYHYSEKKDSVVQISFTKELVPFPDKLNFHHQVLKDTVSTLWSFYKKRYYTDTLVNYNFHPISFMNDSNLTSFYVDYGEGRLIVHSAPVLFTNYYMIKQKGFRHANNLLAQLNEGPVFWNEFDYQNNNTNNSERSNNPLKFLFSHPYLKWGWYLFLFTILLYLVFRSKREQRIIPLMPVNTNASIEFTKAIGTLYFQSKGHNTIVHEIYIVFLSEIRSRYNLSTDIPEAELISQLSQRSGVASSELLDLFRQFRYLKIDEEAGHDDLIKLYTSIENYNKKRK